MSAARGVPQGVSSWRLLRVLLDGENYGQALADQLGISRNTATAALNRMERAGYVLAMWERPSSDWITTGRPPRHFYRINPARREEIIDELRRISKELQP